MAQTIFERAGSFLKWAARWISESLAWDWLVSIAASPIKGGAMSGMLAGVLAAWTDAPLFFKVVAALVVALVVAWILVALTKIVDWIGGRRNPIPLNNKALVRVSLDVVERAFHSVTSSSITPDVQRITQDHYGYGDLSSIIGELHTFYFRISNPGTVALRSARAEVVSIDPLPTLFNGRLPIPLRMMHQREHISALDISGGCSEPVAVATFFRANGEVFITPLVRIETTIDDLRTGIHRTRADSPGGERYAIKVRASADNVEESEIREFEVWIVGTGAEPGEFGVTVIQAPSA